MGIVDRAKERMSQSFVAARDAIKMPTLPSWWKRKDVTAERAAVASQISPMLIFGFFFAAYAAAGVEVGFMLLRVVRMVGDVHWKFDWVGGNAEGVQPRFVWDFALTLHPVLALLLFFASVVVVWFSLFWIPGQIAARGQGVIRRVLMIFVGLLANIFVLSNVIVGQHDNRTEDLRDAAVVAEQAELGRATIERNIVRIDEQLTAMRDQARVGVYAAIAASVGEVAYRSDYMSAEAMAGEPSEARRQIIRRAAGAATRADALEAERRSLETQLEASPMESATAISVTDEAGAGVAWLRDRVDAYQPVALGLTLSLIAIFGHYFAFGLLQARALLDPMAPEAERIAAASLASAAMRSGSSEEEKRDIAEPAAAELDLPPLPDLRGIEDPVFDAIGATVDEEGRVMRRFSGWRGAPKAKQDRRRAPEEEPAESAPPQGDAPAGENDDELSDIASWVRGQARAAEPAK